MSFETYDWENSTEWQEIEKNLYISDDSNRDAIILKRKKKFYKQCIDPNYDIAGSSNSSSSSSSTSSSSRFERDSSSSSSSNDESSTSSSSTSSASSTSSSPRNRELISIVHLLIHICILVCTLLYFVTVYDPELQHTIFSRVFLGGIAAAAIHTCRQYGIPQFNAEYGRKMIYNDNALHFFYCFIFLNAAPFLWLMFPVVTRTLLYLAKALPKKIQTYLPSLFPRVKGYADAIISRRNEITHMSAQSEIFIGIMLIFMAFTGSGNFLQVIMLWQYLRIRYIAFTEYSRAFSLVHHKIQGFTSNPSCPAIIGKGYTKISSWLYSNVDPQQQAQQAQQAPKCTIM